MSVCVGVCVCESVVGAFCVRLQCARGTNQAITVIHFGVIVIVYNLCGSGGVGRE